MHLMYFLDDGGNRVYTLKVDFLKNEFKLKQNGSLTLCVSSHHFYCRRRTRLAPPPAVPTLLVSVLMTSSAERESLARRDSTCSPPRYVTDPILSPTEEFRLTSRFVLLYCFFLTATCQAVLNDRLDLLSSCI